jgi:hypothetical protein
VIDAQEWVISFNNKSGAIFNAELRCLILIGRRTHETVFFFVFFSTSSFIPTMASLIEDHLSDFIPHPTILQLKARSLRNESTPLRGRPPPTPRSKEKMRAEIEPLVDLYNKFEGDLDKIFEVLGEDPNKAKKYREYLR